MVREDTSIVEKIVKRFPHENIVLNKKFNKRKADIWFKNYNFVIEVDEGNNEKYDSNDEKERENLFKKHNFKIFWCNLNDTEFHLFKFLGEIILYISKLCEEIKYSRSDKIKRIKTICQKYFTKLQKIKKLGKELKDKNKKLKNLIIKNW